MYILMYNIYNIMVPLPSVFMQLCTTLGNDFLRDPFARLLFFITRNYIYFFLPDQPDQITFKFIDRPRPVRC